MVPGVTTYPIKFPVVLLDEDLPLVVGAAGQDPDDGSLVRAHPLHGLPQQLDLLLDSQGDAGPDGGAAFLSREKREDG